MPFLLNDRFWIPFYLLDFLGAVTFRDPSNMLLQQIKTIWLICTACFSFAYFRAVLTFNGNPKGGEPRPDATLSIFSSF
jgi:hypothetical protein